MSTIANHESATDSDGLAAPAIVRAPAPHSDDDDSLDEIPSHVVQETVARVRAEYLEMAGLMLTAQQVRRLFSIEEGLCNIVLTSMIDAKFLCMTDDGRYTRLQ